ncbi:MRP repeat motif 7 precursor [Brachionus plicatilis]|uniref:MRP repeat motif 7 n=1 Tax=Brachionus plicatilis TaxID=10195 RepID=A0A3M7RI65_BRAPC|nr:MRP repeat motif 7 precursor [Brachionus plicatilis]
MKRENLKMKSILCILLLGLAVSAVPIENVQRDLISTVNFFIIQKKLGHKFYLRILSDKYSSEMYTLEMYHNHCVLNMIRTQVSYVFFYF